MQDDKTQKLLDESEHKRMAEKPCESKETTESYLNIVAEIIVSLDTQGNIILINDGGYRLLGYEKGELVGKNWFDNCLPIELRGNVGEVFQQLMRGEADNVATYENSVVTKNGEVKNILWHNFLLKNNEGKIIGTLSSGEDISERKLAEKALRESEDRYRAVVEDQSELICRFLPEGILTFVNGAYCRYFGMEMVDLVGHTFLPLIPEEDQNAISQMQALINKENPGITHEHRVILPNGQIRWQQWSNRGIFDLEGRLLEFQAVGRDITERKRVEAMLRESEANWRSLVENIPDVILTIDRDGKVLFINRTFSKSIKPEQAIGTTIYKYVDAEHHENIRNTIEHVFTTGQHGKYEATAIRTNGEVVWYSTHVGPIKQNDKVVALTLITSDITDRKQAEEKLRVSERRYRSLAEASHDMIFIINLDSSIQYANTFASKQFGFDPEQIIGKKQEDLFPPVIADRQKKNLQHVVDSGESFYVEEKLVFPTHEMHIGTWLVPLLNHEGKVDAILGTSRDISERVRAEEALKESETKFRAVADTSVAAIFIYQGEKFIYANPAIITNTGFTLEEFLEKRFWEIVHPDFREMIKIRGLARQRGESIPSRYEFKILTKSGEERWLDFGAGMIHVGGKPAVLGVAFDITERKKVENQLNASYQQMRQLTARLHAVKEEESARIAREIHDELGQTLTGIKMDLSFLEETLIEKYECEKTHPLIKKLNSMSELADGAIQTVRKIATELRPAILDSMGISAAIEWQAEELEHRTGIKCKYTPTLENLELDREHSTAIFRILQESLTNIVRHAKATKVNITFKEEADGLVLEIQDNGKGISKSDMKKKKSFGLLGMKERAWLLGGKVDVQGVQGKGTTIKVRIPLK